LGFPSLLELLFDRTDLLRHTACLRVGASLLLRCHPRLPAACRLLPENLAVLTIPDFIRAGACCRAKSFTEGIVRTLVRDRGPGLRYACDRDHVRAALEADLLARVARKKCAMRWPPNMPMQFLHSHERTPCPAPPPARSNPKLSNGALPRRSDWRVGSRHARDADGCGSLANCTPGTTGCGRCSPPAS